MSSQEQREVQRKSSRASARRRPSVVSYLILLFTVALLLLLMAFFQQRRINSETSDALKQSASAVQSIQNVMTDNEELKKQVSSLQEQVTQLQGVQTQAEELADQLTSMGRRLDAMQYFWQIDDYYARGYLGKAKELISQFETLGLHEFLEQENTTGTDRFSPAQRYEEIKSGLGLG